MSRTQLLGALVLLLHSQLAEQQEAISVETVRYWADEIQKLVSPLKDYLAVDAVRKFYTDREFREDPVTEEVAKKFLQFSVDEFASIAKLTVDEVERIRSAAEVAYINRSPPNVPCYRRSKFITPGIPTVQMGNSSEENPQRNCSFRYTLEFKPDPILNNIPVTENYSTVHVPTNVYDQSDQLQEVWNWTHPLDKTFTSNRMANPQLYWQYFGSSTGYFMFYPGMLWGVQLGEKSPPVDFFDCRTENWYLGASAYPKEVAILVDKSGSMKGRQNIISNATVAEILNTLTENDFFNILVFSRNVTYVDPLVNGTMLQATQANKDRMIRLLQKSVPEEMADYESALKAAFKLIKEAPGKQKVEQDLLGCDQSIMLITDGAPSNFEKIFDEQKVRVFTYLLGQHAYDEALLKDIACKNRGFAVTIATLADVKENVVTYLDVVARSNAIKNDAFTHWTGCGVRQFQINETANLSPKVGVVPVREPMTMPTISVEGPQKAPIMPEPDRVELYTSVSKAVYDRSKKTLAEKKGILLGVAGIDIPIQRFVDTARRWKVGYQNYLFAVNNNGFILFHPDFRPTFKGHLKAYYKNVDISEVEVKEDEAYDDQTALPSYKDELRNLLIKRLQDSTELSTLSTFENHRTVFSKNMKIFTRPVENTPFVLGLAILWPKGGNEGDRIASYDPPKDILGNIDPAVFLPKDNEALCSSPKLDPVFESFLMPYEFCQFDAPLKAKYLENRICCLMDILKMTKQQREHIKCREDYLQRLYLDASKTSELFNLWAKIRKDAAEKLKSFGVEQLFAFHNTGLIRSMKVVSDSLLYDKFIDHHIFGPEEDLFRLTVMTSKYFQEEDILVFHSQPYEISSNWISQHGTPIKMISVPIFKPGQKSAPFAVLGLTYRSKDFAELLKSNIDKCAPGDAACLRCSDDNVQCYVINQSGLILTDFNKIELNSSSKEGKSLRELECKVFMDMVAAGIFVEGKFVDFQGVCIVNEDKNVQVAETGAAWRPQNALQNMFSFASATIAQSLFLIYSLSWSFVQHFLAAAQQVDDVKLTSDSHDRQDIQKDAQKDLNECYKRFQRDAKSFGNTNKTKSNGLPGDLLLCVKKVVSKRCFSAIATSTYTSRESCELVCSLVRDTKRHLLPRLKGCQQPYSSCSQHFRTFRLAETASRRLPSRNTTSCDNCQRGWKIDRIRGTNLLLVVVESTLGGQCSCPCDQEIYIPGQKIPVNETVPLPGRFRKSPMLGRSCEMVPATNENSTHCSNGSTGSQSSFLPASGILSTLLSLGILLMV